MYLGNKSGNKSGGVLGPLGRMEVDVANARREP